MLSVLKSVEYVALQQHLIQNSEYPLYYEEFSKTNKFLFCCVNNVNIREVEGRRHVINCYCVSFSFQRYGLRLWPWDGRRYQLLVMDRRYRCWFLGVHEADYLDQFVGKAFEMLNQAVIRFMEMLVLTAQRLSDRGVAPLVVVVFQCGCLSCKSLKQRRSRRPKVLIILVRKGRK